MLEVRRAWQEETHAIIRPMQSLQTAVCWAAAVEFVVASVPHLARLDRMPWKHKLRNIGSRFSKASQAPQGCLRGGRGRFWKNVVLELPFTWWGARIIHRASCMLPCPCHRNPNNPSVVMFLSKYRAPLLGREDGGEKLNHGFTPSRSS